MTIKDSIKKVLAVIFSIFVFVVMYYGTYLPYNKSQLYIGFLQGLGDINSLVQLEKSADVALSAPSPVGQEELVRNFGNTALNILHQNPNPQLSEAIVNFLMSYYAPIIENGRGINFTQNLLVVGTVYEIAGTNTKNSQYLDQAESYFKEGLALSPRRPQFLYNLFDLYLQEKKFADAQNIANQILTYWPGEPRIMAELTAAEKAK